MHDDQRSDPLNHRDDGDDPFDDALDDLFGPDEDEIQPHKLDDDQTLNIENEAPPSSYDSEEIKRTTERAPTPVQAPASRDALQPGRDWRRIAYFGCLAAVVIPALCLAALIVIGLVVGEQTATPTPPAVQVESTPTAAPNDVDSAGASGPDDDSISPQHDMTSNVSHISPGP